MKLPEPVAELNFSFDEEGVTLVFTPRHYGMLPSGNHNLFTEAQLREALASHEDGVGGTVEMNVLNENIN